MPRKPRIEFEGAIYHVMSRGNRRDDLFLDDRDRELFLDTLDEACTRCGWRIHAFILMSNHYHLLLETPEANLVVGMKWLQGTYTQRFNARHKVCGHLFQGRYKSLLVDGSGDYFQRVGCYVHLNPARAKMIDLKGGKLLDYRWSSYPLYVDSAKRPDWLCVDRLLGSMGLEDDAVGQRAFCLAMEEKAVEVVTDGAAVAATEGWEDIRRGWCLGSEVFRNQMMDRLDGVIGVRGKRESFDGIATREHDEAEACRLLEAGLLALSLDEEQLKAMKKSCVEKCCIARLIRKKTCVSNEWIKRHLYMGKATNFAALLKRIDQDDALYKPVLLQLENIKISD